MEPLWPLYLNNDDSGHHLDEPVQSNDANSLWTYLVIGTALDDGVHDTRHVGGNSGQAAVLAVPRTCVTASLRTLSAALAWSTIRLRAMSTFVSGRIRQ